MFLCETCFELFTCCVAGYCIPLYCVLFSIQLLLCCCMFALWYKALQLFFLFLEMLWKCPVFYIIIVCRRLYLRLFKPDLFSYPYLDKEENLFYQNLNTFRMRIMFLMAFRFEWKYLNKSFNGFLWKWRQFFGQF